MSLVQPPPPGSFDQNLQALPPLSAPSDDPPATPGHNFYTGLSERAKLWILGMGASIACLNLIAAWWLSQHALDSLNLVAADMTPFKLLFADQQFSASERHDLTARAMHIIAISKMIANKQGVVLACFSGAFALAAIGFSLFVIGADGAFKVSSSAAAKARVVFSGTAPGLLCFVICGWLIQQGVTHRSDMFLPPFNTQLLVLQQSTAQGREPGTGASTPCTNKTLFGKCLPPEENDPDESAKKE